jgi:hypothetical protein
MIWGFGKSDAEGPTVIEWERCPFAIMRDLTEEESLWIDWAIESAHAKSQGSFSLDNPTLTARARAIVLFAEDQMAAARVDALAEGMGE